MNKLMENLVTFYPLAFLVGPFALLVVISTLMLIFVSMRRLLSTKSSDQKISLVETANAKSSLPRNVFVLIHGTFAWNASWRQENSSVRVMLKHASTQGRCEFVKFKWSGWNTLSARNKAAMRLAAKIEEIKGRYPTARIFLVGHSHGGSVALLSARYGMTSQFMSGIVALSTPFISATERPTCEIGIYAAKLLVFSLLISTAKFLDYEKDTIGAAWLPIAVFSFIASYFITKFISKERAANLICAINLPRFDFERLLIIRHAGDEALVGISFIQLAGALIGRILVDLSFFMHAAVLQANTYALRLIKLKPTKLAAILLVGVGVALTITALYAGAPLQSSINWTLEAASCVLLVWFGLRLDQNLMELLCAALIDGILTIAAIPILILLALAAILVGPEMAFAGLLVNITVDATPPGRWMVYQAASNESGLLGG